MENKAVHTKAGETYEGKTIVLAPGAVPRKLNIPGEAAFTGKGVSYCATCDADFYEDLDVIVLGNGDAAVEEAGYLTKFANSVTIVVIHDEGILMPPMLQERLLTIQRLNGSGTPPWLKSRAMHWLTALLLRILRLTN